MQQAAPESRTADLSGPKAVEPLRALLDALPCLVATVAADEVVGFVNDAARGWFGVSPEELRGSSLRLLLGRQRYAQVRGQISAVLAGAPQRFEQAFQTATGGTIHAQVDLMPLVVDGLPTGFHILVNDISARVVAEATLEEAITNAALLEERSRIAADMHDRVIQTLYAAGLGAHRAKASEDHAADWIDAIAVCVDQAIGELRDAVRRLTRVPEPASLRSALTPVIRSATRWLGSEPEIALTGPVGSLPAELVHELLLALSRMLALVAVRGDVNRVTIGIDADPAAQLLRLVVIDDGQSTADHSTVGTAAEVRASAEARAGCFDVSPNRPRGTLMQWAVPL